MAGQPLHHPGYFSEKDRENILAALKNKAASYAKCPSCGESDWGLSDGYFFFTMQKLKEPAISKRPGLPCIAVLCNHCGNTQFLNMLILGLGEMLGEKKVEETKKEGKAESGNQ
jgi:hypothetical protein